ncbi:MAG: hypothetical protein J5544_00960, partial [Clostridia bacterium]|nr:hypothetical protein [Clostridia bacterium]
RRKLTEKQQKSEDAGNCILGRLMSAESRAAPQKRRFLCHARRKAQKYSEGLLSIFNEAGRKKVPFEAVYP